MMSIGVLHGPWLPGVALVLVAVAVWRGERPAARELWLAGAMTVGAAAARLACGLWGPLHINGQGPLWIRGALEHGELMSYGPGYFELFAWLARLSATPDRAVFAANALLSALSPAMLYATARLAGVTQGGALAAAAVLAADAVTVRTAASEGYFSPLILLVLGVQAALALGVRARARRDRLAAGISLAAACLLAAAAARIHPAGYLPLMLSPLVVLGAARPAAWRLRVAYAVGAGAAIGATVLLSSGDTVIAALHASPTANSAFAGFDPRNGDLLLALLVLVYGLSRWAKPPWMPVLGVFSLVLMLATRSTFGQHPLWELCYERLFWPGVLLGAAPLLPRRMQGWHWALGSAAVGAAALLVPALPHLDSRTTEQSEYRFLQEVLRDMPPGCTLAAVGRAGKRVWNIPSYLLPRHSVDQTPYLIVERPPDLRDAVVSGDCLLYVRSSLCTSAEARPLCESLEREIRLERVASRVFQAAPSYVDLPYDRPEVEVVVFRVREHAVGARRARPASGAGAAITPAFAQELYDRLAPLRESDGCRVVGLDTSRFSMTVGLQARSGEEYTLDLAHEPDHGDAARRVGAWALAVSAELERDCGLTLAGIERVLGNLEAPAPLGGIDAGERRLAGYAGLLLLVAAGLLLGLAERARRDW
jgi:hypothetical protein